jgi:hypothetical protein
MRHAAGRVLWPAAAAPCRDREEPECGVLPMPMPMSARGHKQTSASGLEMSAYPSRAMLADPHQCPLSAKSGHKFDRNEPPPG